MLLGFTSHITILPLFKNDLRQFPGYVRPLKGVPGLRAIIPSPSLAYQVPPSQSCGSSFHYRPHEQLPEGPASLSSLHLLLVGLLLWGCVFPATIPSGNELLLQLKHSLLQESLPGWGKFSVYFPGPGQSGYFT